MLDVCSLAIASHDELSISETRSRVAEYKEKKKSKHKHPVLHCIDLESHHRSHVSLCTGALRTRFLFLTRYSGKR
jgi:hypothetical protein